MRRSTQKGSSAPATVGTSTRLADCSGRAGSRTSSRRAVRMSHRSKSTRYWRSTPAVKVTKTVGVPHSTLGEIVVACVVPHDGATVEAERFADILRERLASYKVPRHVLFLREDDIALTGSDKIKSGELRELAAQRLSEWQIVTRRVRSRRSPDNASITGFPNRRGEWLLRRTPVQS